MSAQMTSTAQFLATISPQSKELFLDSIATHYGVSVKEIEAEVTAPDAEHLLDYMVEPHRTTASALMRAYGLR